MREPNLFTSLRRMPILLAGLCLLSLPLYAQEKEECLLCHAETDLTGTREGLEFSIYVDDEILGASAHGDLDCVSCHQDLLGLDFHDDEVQPVNCGECHDNESATIREGKHGRFRNLQRAALPTCVDCHGKHDIQEVDEEQPGCGSCHGRQEQDHRSSLHGQATARGDELAPGCSDCHGAHSIQPHSDPDSPTAVMNIPILCGGCHQEGSPVALSRTLSQDHILENYSMSIHGEGLYRQGLSVTAVCTSCHTSHRVLPHSDPKSSIHHDRVAETCAACHSQIEQVHRKIIEGRLWEEEPDKIPACVDCHSPHKIRQVFYPAGLANEDCLTCHSDPALSMDRAGEAIALWVDDESYKTSSHAGIACAQCHTDVTPSRTRSCETVTSSVDCSICHAEVVEVYESSVHGELHAADDPDAPSCINCHSKHGTLSRNVPTSPTFPRNVPLLCAECHRAGQPAAMRINSAIDDIYDSYLDSIHGKGLVESGLLVTATCADCHTAHGELPPDDERSTVHHDNIADTCGSCHHGIEETFKTSVHWPGENDGEAELPSCNSCHSSHTITRADRDDFRFLMMDQCGRCHEDEAETFFDTFHGKVSRLGSAGAAKCYDCHGTHAVLPVSDPNSTLGRDHVVETCGKCHEGSHRRFAGYLTHATHHDPDKFPWLFWTFWGMTILLVGTLSFALLHTLAWLVRLWLSRDEWKAHKALAKANSGKLYRRFNRFNRTLHLLMMISFLTLALTGMALKFSYMGWAQGLAWALGGFGVTGTLHRLGAILLVVVFAVHIADVRRRKRAEGKTWKEVVTGPDSILFTPRDLTEIVQSIKWFFGLGDRPRYGRYTYWEKFDYFAVFWGVIVIGSTGLILWLPELFTHVLPGWSINVATIIHSDEALLAVAFIFTIHFFNTHFRPDKFPMDPVIFTGRVTLDELKYDKPAEYDALMASGELERHLVEPQAKSLERGFKIFGAIALAVGLLLIGLIVYAMLFGYR